MAIANFKLSSFKSVFLSKLFPSKKIHHHEKKSCCLNQLNSFELLSLNGKTVDITYTTVIHLFNLKAKGKVLAVLLSGSAMCQSAILFLAEGDSEPVYYECDSVYLNSVIAS